MAILEIYISQLLSKLDIDPVPGRRRLPSSTLTEPQAPTNDPHFLEHGLDIIEVKTSVDGILLEPVERLSNWLASPLSSVLQCLL